MTCSNIKADKKSSRIPRESNYIPYTAQLVYFEQKIRAWYLENWAKISHNIPTEGTLAQWALRERVHVAREVKERLNSMVLFGVVFFSLGNIVDSVKLELKKVVLYVV